MVSGVLAASRSEAQRTEHRTACACVPVCRVPADLVSGSGKSRNRYGIY
jgi:hypothetical protein